MAFTISGSVITQSGTDTNLSGLSAITNVKTLTTGFKNVYSIPSGIKMQVSGTLTLNSEIEELHSANTVAVEVLNNAVLNIGIVTNVNGGERRSTGTACVFTNSTGSTAVDNLGLVVFNGGELNIEGGDIFTSSPVGWQLGSLVNFNGGRIISTRGNSSLRIRASGTLNLNGGVISDNIRYDFLNGVVTINAFDTRYQTFGGFQTLSEVTGSTGQFIRAFATVGSTYAGDAFRGGLVGFINPITTGGDNLILTHNHQGGDLNISPVIQEVAVNIVDSSGVGVDGAKLYIRDTDNGSRFPSVPVYAENASIPVDQRSDIVYNLTASTDGEIDQFDLYTRFLSGGQSNGGVYGSRKNSWPASTLTQVDYRSTSGDDTDVFNFNYIGYNHAIRSDSVVVQGGGGVLNLTTPLLPDFSITESNEDIVKSYTSIDDSFQFYDIAKSFLVGIYTAEDETIVERVENTIIARDYDVEINPNAAKEFDVLGNKIVIKSSIFIGNITTTGLVTAINGASIQGTVNDTNGFRAIVPIEITNIVPGSQVLIRDISDPQNVIVLFNSSVSTNMFSESVLITGDIDIDVRIRNASGSIKYRAFNTTGSINENGYRLSVTQLLDQ